MIRTHKRKKVSRMHGRNMGTHGGGARKKRQGKGHRGGKGMAGTGKRGDQKKTLVIKLYGNNYFGKQGITSRGTKRDKRDRINVWEIQNKYKSGEVNLPSYKILGEGEIKDKFIITAKEASKSAIEKVEKAGGKIIIKEIKKAETPLVTYSKKAPKEEAVEIAKGKLASEENLKLKKEIVDKPKKEKINREKIKSSPHSNT